MTHRFERFLADGRHFAFTPVLIHADLAEDHILSISGAGTATEQATLYLADAGDHQIKRLAGLVVEEWDAPMARWRDTALTLRGPRAVAVDGGGQIYVADSGNDRIVVLAPDTTTIVRSAAPAAGGFLSALRRLFGGA